jgi:hypothetical protein
MIPEGVNNHFIDSKADAENVNPYPKREMMALVLNDYPAPYATWIKEQRKTIETRWKSTKYRGDLVICCGAKSPTANAGKALCIVELYEVRDMTDADEKAACIENAEGRKAYLLKNWRYFSRDFTFAPRRISGAFQWLFKITIPHDVRILDEPHI